MILKGSQRGGALQLARHLQRTDENDHVEVHELRGFSATTLSGALQEIVAIAKGTRCQQMLFSLSLNPPETADVSIDQFEAAISKVEEKLGLDGQARAIVFHEKEGRRHAHAVWSRIDIETVTAINLPFTHLKLKDVSKQLFLEHGWRLPEGLRDPAAGNPLNFSRAEWQQAKRSQQDPRALKATLQECLAISDSRDAFAQALEAQGFYLAKGDRRGFVAIDYRGEVYALTRWTGRKSKELKTRLGDLNDLPDVDTTKARIARQMTGLLKGYIKDVETALQVKEARLTSRKTEMRANHRAAREALRKAQVLRWSDETTQRAQRFRTGLQGLWDWMTGRSKQTARQNEQEAYDAYQRDRVEREALIKAQLTERRSLQTDLKEARHGHGTEIAQLRADIATYLTMSPDAQNQQDTGHSAALSAGTPLQRDKDQDFDLSP
ncbi:MAG: hypothetical protein Kilf2KO_34960 [Rhodospirillales bacterium]